MDAQTCLKKLGFVGVLSFATVDTKGNPKVQILGYTRYKEMIRLTGRAKPVHTNEQEKWRDIIFDDQPYLANVYPGNTRNIGIIFEVKDMEIEYFNLGVNPIFRESYVIGNIEITEKGYTITENCIECGKCVKSCPRKAIEKGKPGIIHQEHCLHCGSCFEVCSVHAIRKRGIRRSFGKKELRIIRH
ncbi:MAG: 4Fe-4S binding protein [Clostridiales bacterium]|nr:4Fe-4S binding protein [Clostridiales bacterium]